jgi:hypothetical protein
MMFMTPIPPTMMTAIKAMRSFRVAMADSMVCA